MIGFSLVFKCFLWKRFVLLLFLNVFIRNDWFSFVFCYFRVLLKIAENRPKTFPKNSQKASKTPPNLPKISLRCPKMAPRRLQDAFDTPRRTQCTPKTPPRASRLPKTSPDSPKTAPRPLQISIFHGLGSQNLQFFNDCPAHPACQASEHVRGM